MNCALANQNARSNERGFTSADLLVVIAALVLLAAIVSPLVASRQSRQRQEACAANLKQVTRAVLAYAEDPNGGGKLPENDSSVKSDTPKPLWWWYKEQVKGNLGLHGASSPADKVFGCPSDRGYEEGKPFRMSAKFDYGSYVYNGVTLPGYPNIAGRAPSSIKEPARTLLVSEWTARAPLSWHRSKTGSRNEPFYDNAESEVGFVDGHVEFIAIYYDGMNAAGTRDPVPGYQYKYSGD